jgi:Domain of unknown function (DUF4249)
VKGDTCPLAYRFWQLIGHFRNVLIVPSTEEYLLNRIFGHNNISSKGVKKAFDIGIMIILTTACISACKTPYIPPSIKNDNHYLVVNGFINSGNDSTIFSLSRTVGLEDSTISPPELGAQVSILGEFGENYPLQDFGNGEYSTGSLSLNTAETYRLHIVTSNGEEYLSDSVAVLQTPSIDSVNWVQDSTSAASKLGVTIYINTHDPLNLTRYYRWEYVETWEYHAAYDSYYYYVYPNMVLPRDPSAHTYACFRNRNSTELELATTDKLSQNIIYQYPIVFIPQGDEKLSVRYSMLVKQYAISKEAYDYWQSLKSSTELTGSIFDPQPGQITGNVHSLSNPNEPVLGFISASSAQEIRIFISSAAIEGWGYVSPVLCSATFKVPADSVDYYFRGRGYAPITEIPPPNPGWYSAFPSCIDCTLQGGTTTKPQFWP